MPGEQLTCVWQAVYAHEKDNGVGAVPLDTLKEVTAQFASLQSVNYSNRKFDEIFKGKSLTFTEYKAYISNTLPEKGFSPRVVSNEVENLCWDTCKKSYKSAMADEDLCRLWQITNRLIQEGSYPPVIPPPECQWLCDKVASALDKHWKTKDITPKRPGMTFPELLDRMEEVFFQETPVGTVSTCINQLHMCIVEEIIKTGWLFKRTRKQANWTTWHKRWFVLKPGSLEYYEQATTGKRGAIKKGEISITKNTKLENTPNYRGMVHKLTGCFKISNLPMIECELGGAHFSKAERRAWLSSIEEMIEACRTKVTPIQRMLEEIYRGHGESQGAASNGAPSIEIHNPGDKSAVPSVPSNVKKMPPFASPPRQAPTKPKLVPSATGGGHDAGSSTEEEGEEEFDNNMMQFGKDKIKTIFVKIDRSGNGWIDWDEFAAFIRGLGLKMADKDINLVYNTIDRDLDGRISFEEFEEYFLQHIIDENGNGACVTALRSAFLEADRDGAGTLNFKQFAEYYWERKRSIRVSKLFNAFNKMDKKERGVITFNDFRDLHLEEESALDVLNLAENMTKTMGEDSQHDIFERQLRQEYNDADAEQLSKYVRDRWDKFASFRRLGASGEAVMTGGHGMVADLVPGEYSLMDIACFTDLPPLIPKHTVIKGVRWDSSPTPGRSGKVIFPRDFNGVIATDVATNEHLRYYGCSIADAQQVKISLLYRHGIQDFTYENRYLEDYVTSQNGGAGIERHEFSHLDCPLDEDSGIFVLAKFVDESQIHVTGFKVPVRHTLYVPGGCIHSNDYLKGTWRTMLSDETDIDHVHLVRPLPGNGSEDFDHFRFQFA